MTSCNFFAMGDLLKEGMNVGLAEFWLGSSILEFPLVNVGEYLKLVGAEIRGRFWGRDRR